MNEFISAFRIAFKGGPRRARRREYWMFTLVNSLIFLASIVLLFISAVGFKEQRGVAFIALLILIYTLISVYVSIHVGVRRLHDTELSGWNLLWLFLPFIGGIVFLVFCCEDGTVGSNEYGPDPKGRGNY